MSSTNALQVTVVGWAASTPREVTGNGTPYTSFRLATTPRRYDNRQGGFVDGRTEWLTVKAFRDAAFTIAVSIRKGQPVIAHGRLLTEEWTGQDGTRTGLVLEAVAVGHDLTRGRADFVRSVRASTSDDRTGAGSAPEGQDGPANLDEAPDEDDPWALDGPAGDPATPTP